MSQVSKSSMNNLSASAIDSVSSNVLLSSTIAHSSEDRSPDPEVIEIATRRQFSASEKRMLLAEADRCKERGELGAFLRRKHIYSSMLSSWRKQLGAADSAALAPQKRGPKPDASARQIKHLNRDNARLRRKLAEAVLAKGGRVVATARKKETVADLESRVMEDFREQRRRRDEYLADRELDQLVEATNERRRQRGLPERTREQVQREFGSGGAA